MSIPDLLQFASPAWHDRAACRTANPSLFFSRKDTFIEEAKKICETCPVKAKCLEWILEIDSQESVVYGVYGGLTPTERTAISICRVKGCKNRSLNARNSWGKAKGSSSYCEEHKDPKSRISPPSSNTYYMQGKINNGKGSASTY